MPPRVRWQRSHHGGAQAAAAQTKPRQRLDDRLTLPAPPLRRRDSAPGSMPHSPGTAPTIGDVRGGPAGELEREHALLHARARAVPSARTAHAGSGPTCRRSVTSPAGSCAFIVSTITTCHASDIHGVRSSPGVPRSTTSTSGPTVVALIERPHHRRAEPIVAHEDVAKTEHVGVRHFVDSCRLWAMGYGLWHGERRWALGFGLEAAPGRHDGSRWAIGDGLCAFLRFVRSCVCVCAPGFPCSPIRDP